MKKFILFLFTLVLSFCLFGCRDNKDEKITIRILHQYHLDNIQKVINEKYDYIDVQCETLIYPNEIVRRLENNDGTELIVMPQTTPTDINKYFYDLSTTTLSKNYTATIIEQTSYEGALYALPLPGNYSGYVINRTFFNELGLDTPQNLNELLSSLKQLKENNLGVGEDGLCFALRNAYYSDFGRYLLEGMIPDFLGTIDGEKWLQDFIDKESTFLGTWNNITDATDQIIEAGFYDGDVISRKKNSIEYIERMGDGKLAVVYGDTALYNQIIQNNQNKNENGTSELYEYDMIPLLSSENNSPWTSTIPSAYIGINKEVDEKELDACLKVLEVMSSHEGQEALMKDLYSVMSYVVDFENDEQIPNGIKDCIDKKYIYNFKELNIVMAYIGVTFTNYYGGKCTLTEALESIDSYYYNYNSATRDDTTRELGIVGHDLIVQNNNVRYGEIGMGNLVADSVKEISGASIACVNSGGIRASIYSGVVYKIDLEYVCPFDNKIVVIRLDGKTFKEMMENSLATYTDAFPGGRFLQVSGIKYSFDPTKEVGSRLVSLQLENGENIEDNEFYEIAVNDYMIGKRGYLSGNGDGYTMINILDENTLKNENVTLVREFDYTYYDALEMYFYNHQGEVISPTIEGRIKKVNGE